MNSEPGAAILSIFDQMIDRIKQRTPTRSDGKPLGSLVYSQLLLGMPISKGDYEKPFTPIGGASLRESFPPPANPGTGPAAPDRETLLAMQAAWKTSFLCRTMLEVTKDGKYREYPTGRHLDFAFETVVESMQPSASPALSPEVQAQIDAAQKVLHVMDADGNFTGKTPVYANYVRNAQALANAKAAFTNAFETAQRDPVKLEGFAVTSEPLNEAVDEARDSLISEGADRVERALDVIGSVGQPMQDHMILKAREDFDNWNIGLSGIVPGKMPYSFILPTNWCDADDHDGFETITVDQAEVQHFASSEVTSAAAKSWMQHGEDTGGGGGVMLGFAAFGVDHDSASTDSSFQDSSDIRFQSKFRNTAKGLHISMEFGLCDIERPWLVSDLFFMKGWFAKGVKKNSISDGTVDGQADSLDKTLPMIPQQFLVIRNVSISADDWGDDGEVMGHFYGSDQGDTHTDQSTTAGAAGVCLGFINFGGKASHSEATASGQSSSFHSSSVNSHYGSTFDGSTLTMPGTQIVAFLSDIVPACPEIDDPMLSPPPAATT